MKRLIDLFNWIKLFFEGGEEMMIIFLANRIVLGKLAFKDVPNVLKEKVKQELIENGLEFLTVEEA